MTQALQLSEQPIAPASVAPTDAACQQTIAQRLTDIELHCEHLPFGSPDWRVSNLRARHVVHHHARQCIGVPTTSTVRRVVQ